MRQHPGKRKRARRHIASRRAQKRRGTARERQRRHAADIAEAHRSTAFSRNAVRRPAHRQNRRRGNGSLRDADGSMTKQLISASCDQQGRAAFQRDHPCPQITHHPGRHGHAAYAKQGALVPRDAEQRLGREPQRHGGGEHRSLPRPRGERAAPLLLDLASRRGALFNIDARLPKRFGAFVRERPLQSLGAAIRKSDAHGACRPLLVLTGKPVGTDVAIMRKIIQTAIPPGIRAPICPAQQHIGDSRDRERPRCRPDCRA